MAATYEVDTEIIEQQMELLVEILNNVNKGYIILDDTFNNFQPQSVAKYERKAYDIDGIIEKEKTLETDIKAYIDWLYATLTEVVGSDLDRAEEYNDDEEFDPYGSEYSTTPYESSMSPTSAGGGGSPSGGGGGSPSYTPYSSSVPSLGSSYTPSSGSTYTSPYTSGLSGSTYPSTSGSSYKPLDTSSLSSLYPSSTGSGYSYGDSTSKIPGLDSSSGSSYSYPTGGYTGYGSGGYGNDGYGSYGSGSGGGYGSYGSGSSGAGGTSGSGNGMNAAGESLGGSGLADIAKDLSKDASLSSLLGGSLGTGSNVKPQMANLGKTISSSTGLLTGAGIALGLAGIGGGLLLSQNSKYYTFDNEDWMSLSEEVQNIILSKFKEVEMTDADIELFTESYFKIRAIELDEPAKKLETIYENDDRVATEIFDQYGFNIFNEDKTVDRYLLFILMIIDGKNTISPINLYTIITSYSGVEEDYGYIGLNMADYIYDIEDETTKIEEVEEV